MSYNEVDFCFRLVQHFCCPFAQVSDTGAMSTILLQMLFLVEVVGKSIKISLGSHALVKGGVKDCH